MVYCWDVRQRFKTGFHGFPKNGKISFSDRMGSLGIIGFPMKLSDFPFIFNFVGAQMRPWNDWKIIEFGYISSVQIYQKIIENISDFPFIFYFLWTQTRPRTRREIIDFGLKLSDCIIKLSIFVQNYRIYQDTSGPNCRPQIIRFPIYFSFFMDQISTTKLSINYQIFDNFPVPKRYFLEPFSDHVFHNSKKPHSIWKR